jgi:lipoyl(octanoyl) transferase
MELHEEVASAKALPVRGLEVAVDQLRAMFLKERGDYPLIKVYLGGDDIILDSDGVTESWRRRLCEWIFEVVDHFGFDREVVSIALDYLDRTVSLTSEASNKPISKREFQLFAVASLYIAIKLHGETDGTEGPRLKLKITAFEELSRGLFKIETIEAMELRVLSMLKWRMNPPTAAQFVAHLLRLLPEWPSREYKYSYQEVASRIFDLAKYLTELSCFVSDFTFQSRPSTVAYASILCSIDSIHDTLPLPYDVHGQFLANICAATKVLEPGMDQVIRVQRMLKDLSPSMFRAEVPCLDRTVSLVQNEDMSREMGSSSYFSHLRLRR